MRRGGFAGKIGEGRDLQHGRDAIGDTLEFTGAVERCDEVTQGRVHARRAYDEFA